MFALTNRHVSGPPGSVIETFVNGKRQRIGATASTQLLKVDIDKAFPGFEIGKGWTQPLTYTNADAGLIEIDDVNNWTAQIYGLGEIGEVFDLNADTFSLDLIGRRVRAFGAASGELTGEIQGFFYRYKSVGSFGYVSDMIIGPSAGKELTTIPAIPERSGASCPNRPQAIRPRSRSPFNGAATSSAETPAIGSHWRPV